MRSENSSLSPGESPQLGSPWDALLKNSLTPEVVETSQKSLRGKQGAESNQSSHFSWKQLSFRKLSLNDRDGISPLLRYRQTRFSSRRVRKRVIFKHGDVNVIQGNVAKRRRKYLQDIFTTLVDAQWRWTLLVFSLNFLLSWLLFALIWWLIALSHGDLSPKNNAAVAAHLNETFENPNWVPCVVGINSFASCFLFSIETQHTIGYGGRSTSEECPEAIFVMCVQSIVGVMIQAFMVGIVFVKLSRPIKRTHTLLFSRNAVICQRDGVLCLMFRVGDMRKSHIIEAHVRAQLIRRRITKEGELLPFHQEELKVGGDGEEDRIFFIWPTTIVHKIGSESPLYRLSAADLFRERFEIVVILEGIVESTGMTTQARSSYLPNEVLWGHRFEALVSFKKETGEYEVDYSLFNNTYEVETPLCSAFTLDQLLQLNYSSGVRSEINSTDNYQLRRTSSEVLDVNSVDSRLFSENSRKCVDSITMGQSDDFKQPNDQRTSISSSDEDNLIENSNRLTGLGDLPGISHIPIPRSTRLCSNSLSVYIAACDLRASISGLLPGLHYPSSGSDFIQAAPRSPLISLTSSNEDNTLNSISEKKCEENIEDKYPFVENLEIAVTSLTEPESESRVSTKTEFN